MKSRLLLPKEQIDEEDDYEEKKKAMIRRLIEKNQINQVLDELNNAYESRQGEYAKMPTLSTFTDDLEETIPDDLEVYDLVAAMQKVLQRKAYMQPLESKITKVEISIDERCEQIEEYFKMHRGETVNIDALFDKGDRYFAIVTCLSFRVRIRNRKLYISQDANFDKIYLKGRL